MTATFTKMDYTRARAILRKRYPGLAGSDTMDEMVQTAVIRVWEKRKRGASVPLGMFGAICTWASKEVGRDSLRLKAPRSKWMNPYCDEPDAYDVPAGWAQDPENRAVLTEFLDGLSIEEREIVAALIQCGGKRNMQDVAEIVGKRAQRVWHVLWKLRCRLREEGRGSILG